MKRLNFTVTEGCEERLRRLSEATGLKMSDLVRRAIDFYVESQERVDAEPKLKAKNLKQDPTKEK